ncbi:RNA polymerase I associated factor, A49-like protein [Gigaspora margarita]|uniref:RNA polymerase I associated factor, A49-like protein n=1 Tax=Gigaspora margarita TaxID=4874 RepID=A0A8H4AC43_GIGMA|nr:RNA polymerase I associated factor, A49-like protein [Gigaspora margarita]
MGKRSFEVRISEDTSETKPDSQGPILASFQGVSPPQDVGFRTYKNANGRRSMVVGENPRVIYESNEFTTEQSSEYLVAIYNKKTNSVTFSSVPVIDLVPIPKRIKMEEPKDSIKHVDFIMEKTALDKEFGSKKAQAKILARERGNIDASQVHNVDKIVANIEENVKTMKTKEKIKADMESSRPIPPHDIRAIKVTDVYNMDDIVTPAEFDAIPVASVLNAKHESRRLSLLPFKSSKYVNSRLFISLDAKNVNLKRIRLLLYINYLMAFKSVSHDVLNNRQEMATNMNGLPDIILTNLYDRFTETTFVKSGGRKKYKMTPKAEEKLLCYMFTLCLILDDFRLDPEPLACDLGLTTKRVHNLFKALGCKIIPINKQEIESLGLKISQAKGIKRAVLTVPLKLPEYKDRRIKN